LTLPTILKVRPVMTSEQPKRKRMVDGWRGTGERERAGGHDVFPEVAWKHSSTSELFLPPLFPLFLPGTCILLRESMRETENNPHRELGRQKKHHELFFPLRQPENKG